MLLNACNVTTITLILKSACLNDSGDFRPISCCYVIYKCISKLLCSRLKLVLNDIINISQGAFVAVRSILHNIFLCQDIMKHYEWKNYLASCLLKIDLLKAYDMMDWDFIKNMMIALNFPEKVCQNYLHMHIHCSVCNNAEWLTLTALLVDKRHKTRRPNVRPSLCYRDGTPV